MRSIEALADVDFQQALKCVEYRTRRLAVLRPRGFALALGVRYGLMGTAAVHHLLVNSTPEEERKVFEVAIQWPEAVTKHLLSRLDLLPFGGTEELAGWVGRLAQIPLQSALPLLRRRCPLDLALGVAAGDFSATHRRDIRAGWSWWKASKGERMFQIESEKSRQIALRFAERRAHNLEEVPEIALLGE